MERFDLNLLTALDALLRSRSVSEAALKMGVGQPAMSAALARLRALFDDPLFVRTRKGMEPTVRARQLADPLHETLSQLRSLVNPKSSFDPATSTRTFRISGGDYVGMVIVPSLIARLGTIAPGVSLRFRFIEKGRILSSLDEDDIDLAVAVLEEPPKRFATELLFEESFVCLARQDHRIFKSPFSMEAYAGESHLLVTERGDEFGAMDELLARHGLSRHIAITVPQISLLSAILHRTDLIATTGRRAAESMSETCKLRSIELPFATASWRMSMIWPQRNARDDAIAWIRDQMKTIVSP